MAKKAWPADSVETRSIDDLIPYARNARLHTDEQVAQIAASMREWGWTNPVLIDEEGNIIAGHGRILAGRKLNIKKVPCIVARGWTDAQKRAYVIADNKLTINAEWDPSILMTEIEELADMGFDPEDLAFTDAEIAKIRDDVAQHGIEKEIGGASGEDQEPIDQGELVQFMVLMRREERDRCFEIMDKVRNEKSLERVSDALVLIMEAYHG